MARGYSLGAFVKEVYNLVYPVGICIDFDNATNPNTVFPGTTWTQITDGRVVRAATSLTVGSAAGNITALLGADTLTLSVAQLPIHAHGMSNHTHSFSATTGSKDLGTKTVSTFDYGTKTTNTAGAHTHTVKSVGGMTVKNGDFNSAVADTATQTTSSAGNHAHTVAIGSHNHTVVMGTHTHTVSGTTGGSTANTANTGSGSLVNLTNSCHYYARWKRTA